MTITASELRGTLKQTIDLLIARKIDVDEANAVANLASKIVDTAKVEVMAAKVYSDLADLNAPKSNFVIDQDKQKALT